MFPEREPEYIRSCIHSIRRFRRRSRDAGEPAVPTTPHEIPAAQRPPPAVAATPPAASPPPKVSRLSYIY